MTKVAEKTEFAFSELSEQAKNAARDAHRYRDIADFKWWDSVYEDAITVGALMGIEIDTSGSGKTRGNPALYFSGFGSQGDGASYEGRYYFKEGAVAAVKEYAPEDTELHRIAETLTALQVATQLTHGWTHATYMRTYGNYNHKSTMNFSFDAYDGDDSSYSDEFSSTQKDIIEALRDFADWIYKQLEAEHDYLTSDEHLDEYLADLKFDSSGRII